MLPLDLSRVPAAERRALSQRVPAAAHLRAALPRDGGGRARGRSPDRHGAAAAGLGARVRGAAAGLSRSAAPASSRTWSSSPTAATTSSCAGSSASGSSRRITSAATAVPSIEPLTERPLTSDDRARVRRQRAQARNAARAAPTRADERRPEDPSAMGDEDLVNALAQYLDLEPLEKQALLEHARPPDARRVARRAARDEDHHGAHARAFERGALSARLRTQLCPRPGSET